MAILGAAAEELAEVGFDRTTLANVASRASTSIGNVYKYFSGKDELFEATVPASVASDLSRLLRARVEALGDAREVDALPDGHPYRSTSAELFGFALAHRPVILFLLAHAERTRYAGFADEIAGELTKLAIGYVGRAYPGLALSASDRRSLGRLYRSFVVSLASCLREERSAPALERAVAQLSTYHLAGLGALFEAAASKQGGS